MDDGKSQITSARYLYVFHILQEGVRLCRSRENVDHLERNGGTYTSDSTVLLRNMYANQKAAVKPEFGETEDFDIGKGVRQGCILSPLLFNIYAEKT